ncbi:beta-propeller domain-containing protein [Ornithinimicrobium cerasi]|uniref:Beta propeller domain-containing protein n=1 Tax=Ornithinimicrobium cerasi TaxID=2248773 RepID=A0A285VT39_9MICO|nr:beta-propeller domain-containing protein [Ornithinimicrobium cerasi]SOC57225.1 Beta propeller domain-containing protein [Ornithinimicrobium cerasi]
MPRSTSLVLVPLAAALALGGCSTTPEPPGGGVTTGPWDSSAARAAVTALPVGYLADFDDCGGLLTYYQANALELVTPYGIGGFGMGRDGSGVAVEDNSGGGDSGGEAAGGDSPVPREHSSTNVQEEGVDEADLVKTDGRIIVTTTGGRVRVVDVDTETVVSEVQMPGRRDQVSPSELLLHGSTLVVLGQEWGSAQPVDGRFLPFGAARTVVMTVDLSDPSSPRTLGSVRIEGSYRSARMVGDTVRMVMVTEPVGVEQTTPRDNSLGAESAAEEANRDLVRSTTIDDWVPHVQVLDADGGVLSTEQLLACDEISRPRDPAGLSTMSVLSFDVASGSPTPTSGSGLVASGDTVYASSDRVVVATSGWDLWRWVGPAVDAIWPTEPVNRTDLHTFDISDPGATTYVASGSVEGHLLSQWALDEQDGVLRVATTTDPPGASQQSESALVMLREEDDELVETGRVDGLGVTEQIRAVRYLSPDLAAVVTFRQTDPLYLVDTSDPAAPVVAGELKIPGYSAYLHPVGEGWLLGVGQDADESTGQTKGLQASLFDIRDLRAPRQTAVLTWPNGYSPVENDHRAFTSWPATGQVFLPLTVWSDVTWDGIDPAESGAFGGVVALDVGDGTLRESGRVPTGPKEQPDWTEGPMRTMVIGEDLWTLGWQGLSRFDLATLEGGWVVDLP